MHYPISSTSSFQRSFTWSLASDVQPFIWSIAWTIHSFLTPLAASPKVYGAARHALLAHGLHLLRLHLLLLYLVYHNKILNFIILIPPNDANQLILLAEFNGIILIFQIYHIDLIFSY